MKRRIAEISVLQTSRVMAIVYGGLGVVASCVMLIVALSSNSNSDEDGGGGGKSIIPSIVVLFIYPIVGFVGTAALASFYNFIAKRFGGIEFTIASEPFPHLGGFAAPRSQNVDEELRKLARLKDDGVITEEEFSRKKQILLSL